MRDGVDRRCENYVTSPLELLRISRRHLRRLDRWTPLRHRQLHQVRTVHVRNEKCFFNILCVFSNPKFFPLDGANSWFWSSTGRQLVDSPFSAWSKSGGVRTAQPDNLVNRYGGPVEACLAVLNDWYGDGVAWHDMVCADSLPVICEQP